MAITPHDSPLPLTEEERLRRRDDVLADDQRIALVEERVHVGKRVVDQGGVRLSTRTETRTENLHVTLEDVAVEVDRVPVGRFVEAAEEARVEGDVTILPVYEERLVVEKRLFLVEEVHVRRLVRAHEVEVPVELSRQVAEVERIPPEGQPTQSLNPTQE